MFGIDAIGAIRRLLGWTGPPLDFWGPPFETLTIPAVAADTAITGNVTVVGIPAGATWVRVIAMFKYRKLSAVAASALTGAQEIQVKVHDAADGTYIDAINFIDNQYTLAAGDAEGGDVIFGYIDVKATVAANDDYTFRWAQAVADSALVFTGVQMGLRVWYR